jgi:hypothetical protein
MITLTKGAVRCGSDCYLGESVSGDSVCREAFGRVTVLGHRIWMNRNTGRVDDCALFNFLVFKT